MGKKKGKSKKALEPVSAQMTDAVELQKYRKNGIGFLIANKALLARESVMDYKGYELPEKIRKELGIDYDDLVGVYQPLSALTENLEQYDSLPLTDGHVWEPMTVKDTSAMSGLATNPVKTPKGVGSRVTVTNSDSIVDIETGIKTMLSLGYKTELEIREGTFQGAPYRVVKTNIRPNHIALTGNGRCGPECSVFADTAPCDCTTCSNRRSKTGNKKMSAETETVVMDDEAVNVAVGDAGKVKKYAARLKDSLAENEKLKTDLADEKKKRKDLEADFTDEKIAELVAKGADERAAILTKARAVMGDEADFDGKTNAVIMADAIKKAGNKVSDAKKDDASYLAGLFDSLPEPKAKGGDRVGKTFADMADSADDDEEYSVEKARAKFAKQGRKSA